MKPNVPISETGIVIAGISVLRQLCRNRKITMTTIPIASASVLSTSWMDSPTAVVVSNAMTYFSPAGNVCERRSNSATNARVDVESICIRQLQYADTDDLMSVEIQVR